MKNYNIKLLEKNVLTHKSDYMNNRLKFREDSLVFIYNYSRIRTNDEDMATDIYIEAEKIIDRLIQNYFSKDGDYYLQFLKTVAKRLIQNRFKVLKKSKEFQENVERLYLFSEERSLEDSIAVNNFKNLDEIDINFLKIFMDFILSRNELIGYAFYLRYDIPMESRVLWSFRKHLLCKNISLINWKREHLQKKWEFQEMKSKLVEFIHRMTWKIMETKNYEQVLRWKEKKRLKMNKLNCLLNQGLYSTQDLSEVLGVDGRYILRNMSSYKDLGIRYCNSVVRMNSNKAS